MNCGGVFSSAILISKSKLMPTVNTTATYKIDHSQHPLSLIKQFSKCANSNPDGENKSKFDSNGKRTLLLRKKTKDDWDLECPICIEILKDAFITKCGHSFCRICITKHLKQSKDCPTCKAALSKDFIFPNFSLNKVLQKITEAEDSLQNINSLEYLQSSIISGPFNSKDIDHLISTLEEKKELIDCEEQRDLLDAIMHFLLTTKEEKEKEIERIKLELNVLSEDIKKTVERKEELCKKIENIECNGLKIPESKKTLFKMDSDQREYGVKRKVEDTADSFETKFIKKGVSEENFSSEDENQHTEISNPIENEKGNHSLISGGKKNRVEKYCDELQTCYFSTRVANESDSSKNDSLETITSTISNLCRFDDLKVIATLRYGEIFNSLNIVSSVEFDRDEEFFASAGVSKKIKIFEYASVVHQFTGYGSHTISSYDSDTETNGYINSRKNDNSKESVISVHCPIKEIPSRSKISCLSWNPCIKPYIGSSDYEGVISVWDAFTGKSISLFDEHEKRSWSIDFSTCDPFRLASGSDDSRVKIWSTTQKKSVLTIEAKANVCCVQFNPFDGNMLAFGSADHDIHLYDIRFPRDSVSTFKGHRKAVSYVKFMSRTEMVSASTDSSLKLWTVNQDDSAEPGCVRTYSGHLNEKNFVGLACLSDPGYIACGSESNSIYIYMKELAKPIVISKFGGTNNQITGQELSEDDNCQFVSSVCWKKKDNVLLAANSHGTIKVLEFV